jgi:hypothetical protein
MTAREVIYINAEILLRAGIPSDRVIKITDDALEMLPSLVGKAPL